MEVGVIVEVPQGSRNKYEMDAVHLDPLSAPVVQRPTTARCVPFGVGRQARVSAMRVADDLRARNIAAAALFKPALGGWIVRIFPGGVRPSRAPRRAGPPA